MELSIYKKPDIESDLNLKFVLVRRDKFNTELEANIFSMEEALKIYHVLLMFLPIQTLYYLNQYLNMEVVKFKEIK